MKRKNQGVPPQQDRHADIPRLPAEDIVDVTGDPGQPWDSADEHSDQPLAQPDHSERKSGGDQDIDTAGQVPE